MLYPQDVILKPIVTEKTTGLLEENKYVFKVHMDANKIEIGQAIEKLFKVEVADVKTMRVYGIVKHLGRNSGKTPDWKKAIVTLKEGNKIPLFEGV